MKKNRYINILAIIVMGLAASFTFRADVSQAGGINGNEARVIGAASGSFEYDGEIYVAKQEYISQLNGYLSKDSVNLTAEQADKAISKIYSSVATGVRLGYIVKTGSSGNSDNEDSSGDAGADSDSGGKSGSGKKDSGEDSASKEGSSKEGTSKGDETSSDNSDSADNSSDTDDASPKAPQNTDPNATMVPSIVEQADGTVDVYDNSGNPVASIDGVMKNTGYSLYNSMIMLGVMVMVLLITIVCGIILIRKNQKIADEHAART